MREKSMTALALVIKCCKYQEKDLLVTLLTENEGKILVNAKGVRKLNSSKKACLQTGNLIKVHLIITKGWPILTQAQLVTEITSIRQNLCQLKKFLLFMEILDRLLVHEELDINLFQKIIYLHQLFLYQVSNKIIKKHLLEILRLLGYVDDHKSNQSITSRVNEILTSNLCTYDYLTLPAQVFATV